jgi:ribosome-binding protein aMBF1 (putative translation factor)
MQAPAGKPAGVFSFRFRRDVPKRRKRKLSTDHERSHLTRFAAEVRAGRAVLGWSQTEFAKRAAVTLRAIYSCPHGMGTEGFLSSPVRPRRATLKGERRSARVLPL